MSRVPPPLPVTLDVAPLPRTQIGPFLILGVGKDADRNAIEAAWAQRLIWSRKGQAKSALEDVNWARESLNDPVRRLRADAASLNVDTCDGVLKRFKERFQGKDKLPPGCRPLDVEKNLADYEPALQLPDREELRRNLPEPEIPREVPAVAVILEDFVRKPIDPWEVDL
ncbi:MAG: hypothetical protein L0Y72_20600 [Gemmataceae bacterium]|nr:hypothetical protein [Gemmataceae bacterium]MCI0741440.1 hypothetical protein [Gemmataceae bacterium]